MSTQQPVLLVLHPQDNVGTALIELRANQLLQPYDLVTRTAVGVGHKVARCDIAEGEEIFKYGQVIGVALAPIRAGEAVHSHNISAAVTSRTFRQTSRGSDFGMIPPVEPRTFDGYPRGGGRAGTRNYLGVLATVSCSAEVCRLLADRITDRLLPDFPEVDGVIGLGHGLGCCHAPGSQGLEILRRTLDGYAVQPNFGGILLIGLGCETNQVDQLLQSFQRDIQPRLKALTIQECGGTAATIEAGMRVASEMLPAMAGCRRRRLPLAQLAVGLECGGSDSYSGITANPALGVAVDLLVGHGATAILSETPEIYGAEHLLTERAINPTVAEELQELIAWWEAYAKGHGAVLDNNPTPGNKAGGISTILEKSLGAVAKSGSTPLRKVYRYAEQVTERGLVFMDTPGYDVVSITGMIAGGANLVCFTTGRGSVCGFRPVPTLKLASNTSMYQRLQEDMDLDCGGIVTGTTTVAGMGAVIFEELVAVASGKQTKSEQQGFGGSEFVPWPQGAVL